MFFLGKCVRTVAKTMVVDRKKEGTSNAMFGVGTAAKCCELTQNTVCFDVPTEFAGGDQLLVSYVIPTMSVLRIDWSRFFCYASYALHVTANIYPFT